MKDFFLLFILSGSENKVPGPGLYSSYILGEKGPFYKNVIPSNLHNFEDLLDPNQYESRNCIGKFYLLYSKLDCNQCYTALNCIVQYGTAMY